MSHEKKELTVQTCGICEMMIPSSLIPIHTCLESYSRFYVDLSTSYFYPMTDDGNIIKKSFGEDEEFLVLEETDSTDKENCSENGHPLKRKFSRILDQRKRRKGMSFDDKELLISEVKKREALWNLQLDITHRNKKERDKLWQEVSEALDGRVSPETAKNKFKSLHDTYRKIIQAEQKTSGSARPSSTRLWHYYKNMEFLRDSCLVKTTVSNIRRPSIDDSNQPLEETDTVQSGKRSRCDLRKCNFQIHQTSSPNFVTRSDTNSFKRIR